MSRSIAMLIFAVVNYYRLVFVFAVVNLQTDTV